MTYKCINCGYMWVEGIETNDISHGYCRDCLKEILTEKIRAKQLIEGNFDCFNNGTDYCDQYNCKYYWLCVDLKN